MAVVFPENWLIVAVFREKLPRDDSLAGKLADDGRCFRKTTHDGRGFRKNWFMMAVFLKKGSCRQRFPENGLMTVELSGKTD
jgi:hypothetical protein